MTTTPPKNSGAADTASRRLDMALEGRHFEISLFWQRSLFFWGFNAAALVAAGSPAVSSRPDFALVVRCFGFICALTWVLANRGSKYWHEAWERKVQREELSVVGPLYGQLEPLRRKGRWLSARRYSVSRLAMALADYVFCLWLALLASQALITFKMPGAERFQEFGLVGFLAGTLVFAVAIVVECRSGPELVGSGDS